MRVHCLEHFGERIPQAPSIADREVLECRLAPLDEHIRDLSRRDRRAIHRPDDDVMREAGQRLAP